MLGSDWVALAKSLEISDSDINIIKSQYPNNIPQQAIVMLRLWMQLSGNRATGNTLEKGLRSIHRDDIVNECISNLEVVTDESEKAMAKERLETIPQKPLVAGEALLAKRLDGSPEVSYDEKDIMKEAESAEEDEDSQRILQVPNGQEEEVIESPIVPQPRSTTVQATSQIVVDSFEEKQMRDVPEPAIVEEALESQLYEPSQTLPYEIRTQPSQPVEEELLDKPSLAEKVLETLKLDETSQSQPAEIIEDKSSSESEAGSDFELISTQNEDIPSYDYVHQKERVYEEPLLKEDQLSETSSEELHENVDRETTVLHDELVQETPDTYPEVLYEDAHVVAESQDQFKDDENVLTAEPEFEIKHEEIPSEGETHFEIEQPGVRLLEQISEPETRYQEDTYEPEIHVQDVPSVPYVIEGQKEIDSDIEGSSGSSEPEIIEAQDVTEVQQQDKTDTHERLELEQQQSSDFEMVSEPESVETQDSKIERIPENVKVTQEYLEPEIIKAQEEVSAPDVIDKHELLEETPTKTTYQGDLETFEDEEKAYELRETSDADITEEITEPAIIEDTSEPIDAFEEQEQKRHIHFKDVSDSEESEIHEEESEIHDDSSEDEVHEVIREVSETESTGAQESAEPRFETVHEEQGPELLSTSPGEYIKEPSDQDEYGEVVELSGDEAVLEERSSSSESEKQLEHPTAHQYTEAPTAEIGGVEFSYGEYEPETGVVAEGEPATVTEDVDQSQPEFSYGEYEPETGVVTEGKPATVTEDVDQSQPDVTLEPETYAQVEPVTEYQLKTSVPGPVFEPSAEYEESLDSETSEPGEGGPSPVTITEAEGSKPTSDMTEFPEEAVPQDGFTQPSVDASQMVQEALAPTDVKPPISAGGQSSTVLPQQERETGEQEAEGSKTEDDSRQDTAFESYGELSDDDADDVDSSLITITNSSAPQISSNTTTKSSTFVTTSVDPSGGETTTIVTTRVTKTKGRGTESESEESEMSDQSDNEQLRKEDENIEKE